jgi:hypothetical protein
VSDTPRTDKESFFPHDSKYKVCDEDFAKQLERELNEARELIKRLEVAAWKNYNNSHKAKEAKP